MAIAVKHVRRVRRQAGRPVHADISDTGVEVDHHQLGRRGARLARAGARRQALGGAGLRQLRRLRRALARISARSPAASPTASAGASFELDGKTYKTPANERPHTAAWRTGGPRPHRLGRPTPTSATNAVRLHATSPDGAHGLSRQRQLHRDLYAERQPAAARARARRPTSRRRSASSSTSTSTSAPARTCSTTPIEISANAYHRDRRGPDPDRRSSCRSRARSTTSASRARCATAAGKPVDYDVQPRARQRPRLQGPGRDRQSGPTAR